MNTQNLHGPLVRVKRGCLSNLPEGCKATKMKIGTWNVPTLNNETDFKLQNLLCEMTRLKINILGIAETHWSKEMPESFEQDGYVIIKSSRNDKIHRQGVGIVLSKDTCEYMCDYELCSEKIMSIEIEVGKKEKLRIF